MMGELSYNSSFRSKLQVGYEKPEVIDKIEMIEEQFKANVTYLSYVKIVLLYCLTLLSDVQVKVI